MLFLGVFFPIVVTFFVLIIVMYYHKWFYIIFCFLFTSFFDFFLSLIIVFPRDFDNQSHEVLTKNLDNYDCGNFLPDLNPFRLVDLSCIIQQVSIYCIKSLFFVIQLHSGLVTSRVISIVE